MKRVMLGFVILLELVFVGMILFCAFSILTSTKVHTNYPTILVWMIIGVVVATIIETKLRKWWNL